MRGQWLERALSGTSQGGKCERLDRSSRFPQDGQELQHPLDLSEPRLHIENAIRIRSEAAASPSSAGSTPSSAGRFLVIAFSSLRPMLPIGRKSSGMSKPELGSVLGLE